MIPDPSRLREAAGITTPLIGLYDAPDPEPFAPLVAAGSGAERCVFSRYRDWCAGRTLHLTREQFGCGGAGRALCGVESMEREDFVQFLAVTEGLKDSPELMQAWIDATPLYRQEHEHLLIGPLKSDQYRFLKTITFWVNPDQLSLLMTGAQYRAAPGDPPPVIAPFGAGCMQLVTLFPDLERPQAMIGATDIAMRKHLPPELLALTATRPMYEQLCALDERSFLAKPFWKQLRQARGA